MSVDSLIRSAAYRWGLEQHGEELAPFIELLREEKLGNVLEVGVRRGGTVAIWHELSEGKVIGIDLPEALDLPEGFNRDRHRELLQEYSRFHSVLEDSRTAVGQVKRILNGELLSFLFLDGDHSEEGVRRDFETYASLVAPGGLIAFHDIVDSPFTRSVNCRVCEFWKTLSGDKQEFCIDAEWGGIGVLRV